VAKRPAYGDTDCSVARTLAVIGDRWTMLILRNALHGMRTFDAFQEHLDISPSVLSDRLSTLTKAGVFDRRQSASDGRSFEYRLTEKGLDLYPVIVALMDWGDKWEPSEKGERLRLIERATGKKIRGAIVLSQDGKALRPQDVTPLLGPAAADDVRQLVEGDWRGRAKR